LPELLEKEPNDSEKSAQRVKLPVIVNGRIDRPGDWDFYRFTGRAGQELVAEVTARRLGSPLDSMLRLSDARGRQIASTTTMKTARQGCSHTRPTRTWRCDCRPMARTIWRSATPNSRAARNTRIASASGAPRPRFRTVRNASERQCRPRAQRADGGARRPQGRIQRGRVALALNGAPAGYAAERRDTKRRPGRRAVHARRAGIGVAAGAGQSADEGRAMVQGREVVRMARPADDMTQASSTTTWCRPRSRC